MGKFVNAIRELEKLTKKVLKVLVSIVLAFGASGCSFTSSSDSPIIIGQKSGILRLDPASIYSVEDQEPVFQAFGSLFNATPGNLELVPDLAESGEFVSPTEFQVIVRDGLRFSNGNTLNASDVKHSIDRMKVIDDPNGPQILLQYLKGVRLVDERTVIFTLAKDYDQTFTQVLSSVATVIVDEEVFPIDRALTPDEIIAAGSFSGPYVVEAFDPDSLVSLKPNKNFAGIWGKPKNSGVIIRYYADSNNLALDAKTGQLDVTMIRRALAPLAIESALNSGGLNLVTSQGAAPVMLSFRMDVQPYGFSRENKDPVKARAIRQAVGHLLDRQAIAEIAYGGSVSPAYSIIPKGLVGHSEILKGKFGNGKGKPDLDKASGVLKAAGLQEAVTLRLLYSPDRYGPMTEVSVNLIKDQLERDGLFEVEVFTAEWSAFREIRKADKPEYDVYFIQWSPDFADPDNYLSPLFGPESWLATGFSNVQVNNLISEQLSIQDSSLRDLKIKEIELALAEELPAIVFGMEGRSALVKDGISGMPEILDVTFKLKYGFLSRR